MTGSGPLNCIKSVIFVIVFLSCASQVRAQQVWGQVKGVCLDDSARRPVLNVRIELMAADSVGAFTMLRSVAPDSAGNFLFDSVPAGEYYLRCAAPVYPPQWYCPNGNTSVPQFKFPVGTAPMSFAIFMKKSLTVNPPSTGGGIHGTVVDESTRAVLANAQVELCVLDSLVRPQTKFVSHADAAGYFAIDSVPSLSYFLRVSAPDTSFPVQWYSPQGNTRYPQYSMWIGAMVNTLEIDLKRVPIDNSPNCKITVLVRDSLGGPVYQGTVQLLRTPDLTTAGKVALTTASQGIAVFAGLSPGAYAVFLTCPPYQPQYYDSVRNTVSLRSLISVTSNDTLTLTARLTARPAGDGRISGKVLSEIAQPMAGDTVQLYAPSDLSAPLYSAVTDNAGAFRFDQIIIQQYDIKLVSPGAAYPDQWYSAQRKATTRFPDDPLMMSTSMDSLFISLATNPVDNSPSSMIILSVQDSGGAQLPQSMLTTGKVSCINRATGATRAMILDQAWNRLYLGGLSAGQYSLRIEMPGYPVQYYSPAGTTAASLWAVDLKDRDTVLFETRLQRTLSSADTTTSYAFFKARVTDSLGSPLSGTVQVLDSVLKVITQSPLVADGWTIPMRVPAMKSLFCAFVNQNSQRFFWSPQGMTSQPSTAGVMRVPQYDTQMVYMYMAAPSADTVSARIFGTVVDSANMPVSAQVLILDSMFTVMRSAASMSTGQFGPIFIAPASPFFIAIDALGKRYYYQTANGIASSQPGPPQTLKTRDSLRVTIRLPMAAGSADTAGRAATISGVITSLVTNGPVRGARVYALPPGYFTGQNFNPGQLWASTMAMSDSTGYYVFRNLPWGDYLVCAVADSANLVAQFYQNADLPLKAKTVRIDSVNRPTLNFQLRLGGIMQGSVTASTGAPITNANINIWETATQRWAQATTDATGNFKIVGLSSGTWKMSVYHPQYLMADNSQNGSAVTLQEGTTITLPAIVMAPGGRIAGSFVAPFPLADSLFAGLGAQGGFIGRLLMFSDSSLQNDFTCYPRNVAGVQVFRNATDFSRGTFVSDICPTGRWRCVFQPYAQTGTADTGRTAAQVKPWLGWSVLGGDTVISAGAQVDVVSFDTTAGVTLAMRKGYSVTGAMRDSAGAALAQANVSVFVKNGSRYACVGFSDNYGNGTFKVTGLMDGGDYYLNAWTDGYPSQFWSPDTVTGGPVKPYRFSAASFTPIAITLKSTIVDSGAVKPDNQPISLFAPGGDTAVLKQVSWNINYSLSLDSCFLYGKDSGGAAVLLFKTAVTAGVRNFSWQETRTIRARTAYVAVGKGAGVVMRSNSFWYEPRTAAVRGDSLWIAVSGKRWGVGVEWGGRNLPQNDSVSLFRRTGADPWQLVARQSSWSTSFGDYSWSTQDSGKTFQYHVELLSSRRSSGIASFTLDRAFFALQPKPLYVGLYEHYQTIQSAIDAAGNNDVIVVRSGTYAENLNFKGKIVALESDWQYGKPPVIDGGGGVAVTIPWAGPLREDMQPDIGGFKIQNASTGIKTGIRLSVKQCLFTGVTRAIETAVDSAAMVNAMLADPFVDGSISVWSDECTFIAAGAGSVAGYLSAHGLAEATPPVLPGNGYEEMYVLPAYSLTSRLSLSHALVVNYFSAAGSAEIPVRLAGNTPSATISDCDFWRSGVTPGSTRIQVQNTPLTLDPHFIDTVCYFLPDTSALRSAASDGMVIGYDGRRFSGGSNNNGNAPSAITGLTVRQVGLAKIALSWNPSPDSEHVKRYMVYRCPGDTDLFYVNDQQQWEPKVSPDSMYKVIDTFSMRSTTFTDTTLAPGKPCLYVVAGIDSAGNQGRVDLPASVPIKSRFVNTFTWSAKVPGQQWIMLSAWGADSLPLNLAADRLAYRWDDSRSPDKMLSQYVVTGTLRPGAGCWFWSERDTQIVVSAATLVALRQREATLSLDIGGGNTGWNQVSSPLPFAIAPAWLDSVAAWEWVGDSLGYRRASSLEPFKAYWVYTSGAVSLPLRNEGAGRASAKRAAGQWELRLSLAGKGIWDRDNFCGVGDAGGTLGQVLEPPAGFGGTQLYFAESPVQTAAGSVKDIRLSGWYVRPVEAAKSAKLEWKVGITRSEQTAVIAVTGCAQLPKGAYAFWIERDRVVNLLQKSTIEVAPHTGDVFGYLVVSADQNVVALYTNKFVLHPASPNPFRGGTAISFVIPYQWLPSGAKAEGESRKVKLEVYSLAGRKVRTLINGDVAVGTHRVVWDGAGDNGRGLSGGMYLVRLTSGTSNATTRIFKVR